jgi:hypothetical protein
VFGTVSRSPSLAGTKKKKIKKKKNKKESKKP